MSKQGKEGDIPEKKAEKIWRDANGDRLSLRRTKNLIPIRFFESYNKCTVFHSNNLEEKDYFMLRVLDNLSSDLSSA